MPRKTHSVHIEMTILLTLPMIQNYNFSVTTRHEIHFVKTANDKTIQQLKSRQE